MGFHIIFSGWGFLVFVLPIVLSLIMVGLNDLFFHERSPWLLYNTLLASGLLLFWIGRRLNKSSEVKAPVSLDNIRKQWPKHTFFFIRMEIWGVLIIALSIALALKLIPLP